MKKKNGLLSVEEVYRTYRSNSFVVDGFLLIFFSFLIKSKKDMELRKWAAEGLSFLTMEADVKVRKISVERK